MLRKRKPAHSRAPESARALIMRPSAPNPARGAAKPLVMHPTAAEFTPGAGTSFDLSLIHI